MKELDFFCMREEEEGLLVGVYALLVPYTRPLY